MGQSIVQIRQMGDALRSSGYKSIDSALAELIDNSIEAGGPRYLYYHVRAYRSRDPPKGDP